MQPLIRRTSASNETYTIKLEEAVTQTADGYIRVGTDGGRERVPTRAESVWSGHRIAPVAADANV